MYAVSQKKFTKMDGAKQKLHMKICRIENATPEQIKRLVTITKNIGANYYILMNNTKPKDKKYLIPIELGKKFQSKNYQCVKIKGDLKMLARTIFDTIRLTCKGTDIIIRRPRNGFHVTLYGNYTIKDFDEYVDIKRLI